MKEIYFDNCLVGSGPAAIGFMLARNHYSNQKDKILWIEGGHAYVEQNVVQQSSGSQTPELQGDKDRVLVQFN